MGQGSTLTGCLKTPFFDYYGQGQIVVALQNQSSPLTAQRPNTRNDH